MILLRKKLQLFFLSVLFLLLVIVVWGLILKIIDVIFIKQNNYSLIDFLKNKQSNRIFSQSYYLKYNKDNYRSSNFRRNCI